ncbi:MAG: ribose-phosphate diphosphokinase [Flavobacteriaceae bacterium]
MTFIIGFGIDSVLFYDPLTIQLIEAKMKSDQTIVFSLGSYSEFGRSIANAMGLELGAHEERNFSDGECKTRALINVYGKNIVVVEGLFREPGLTVHDKLCRLLFFIGSLKDAGAIGITVVVPYLCYSRKDRKTKSQDPVATKYVAVLFESMGVDRCIALEVHNLQAFQNAFRIPTVHLEATASFAAHFAPLLKKREVVVLSPDAGGMKRASFFAQALENELNVAIPVAIMHKTRSEGMVSGAEIIYGDIQNRTVIIYDDLISSGTTLVRAAKAAKKAGADWVYAAATHGVFSSEANKMLADPVLDGVVITNSISWNLLTRQIMEKIEVIDIVPMIAGKVRDLVLGSS